MNFECSNPDFGVGDDGEEVETWCDCCEEWRASLAAAEKALVAMTDERNDIALAAALTDAKIDEIRNLLHLLEASRGAAVPLLVYVETLELTLQSIRGVTTAGGSDGV